MASKKWHLYGFVLSFPKPKIGDPKEPNPRTCKPIFHPMNSCMAKKF